MYEAVIIPLLKPKKGTNKFKNKKREMKMVWHKESELEKKTTRVIEIHRINAIDVENVLSSIKFI